MKEIYTIIIFFLLKGIINPSFEEFQYFFLLNTIHISKLMFSFLVVIGQVCHVIGALIYKEFCRAVETRQMVKYAFTVRVFGMAIDYCFAKRYNLQIGLSDISVLFFTDVTFSTLSFTLFVLPIMALFAKITPNSIEGTIFAFLTGTKNFSNIFLSPAIGVFINKYFFGVNKTDLTHYPDLIFTALIGSIL